MAQANEDKRGWWVYRQPTLDPSGAEMLNASQRLRRSRMWMGCHIHSHEFRLILGHYQYMKCSPITIRLETHPPLKMPNWRIGCSLGTVRLPCKPTLPNTEKDEVPCEEERTTSKSSRRADNTGDHGGARPSSQALNMHGLKITSSKPESLPFCGSPNYFFMSPNPQVKGLELVISNASIIFYYL